MQAAWASLRRRMREKQERVLERRQQRRAAEGAAGSTAGSTAEGAAGGVAGGTAGPEAPPQPANAAHVDEDEVQVVQEVTSRERDAQLRREAVVLGDSDDEKDASARGEGTTKKQKVAL